MIMSDICLNKELEKLKKDKLIFERELECERAKIAKTLIDGGMGKEIDDVLSGRKTIKVSFLEKTKYKIKFYLDRIFNLF